MKTLLIYTLIILVFGSANAKPIRDVISIREPMLDTESYIDDIPFDTELVVGVSLMMNGGWETCEEANVADIPFDTRSIANEVLFDNLVAESRSEPEAKDIPFDTQTIFEEWLMVQMVEEYKSEQIASDIQFDTQVIASNTMLASAVENYREEAEVNDIPYMTICIISASYNNEPAYVVVKKKADRKSNRRHGKQGEYYYSIIQPPKIEVSAPILEHNTLTRELLVMPGSSL